MEADSKLGTAYITHVTKQNEKHPCSDAHCLPPGFSVIGCVSYYSIICLLYATHTYTTLLVVTGLTCKLILCYI